jgi:hypothetical protein
VRSKVSASRAGSAEAGAPFGPLSSVLGGTTKWRERRAESNAFARADGASPLGARELCEEDGEGGCAVACVARQSAEKSSVVTPQEPQASASATPRHPARATLPPLPRFATNDIDESPELFERLHDQATAGRQQTPCRARRRDALGAVARLFMGARERRSRCGVRPCSHNRCRCSRTWAHDDGAGRWRRSRGALCLRQFDFATLPFVDENGSGVVTLERPRHPQLPIQSIETMRTRVSQTAYLYGTRKPGASGPCRRKVAPRADEYELVLSAVRGHPSVSSRERAASAAR